MGKSSNFWQAFKSACSALFGVQSSQNHQRDFESHTPFPFILAGVILVIGFLLLVAVVVNSVIPSTS